MAKAPGTYPVILRLAETGQTIQTHIVVKESDDRQIQDTSARFVEPLDDEIRRMLPTLSPALVPELAQITFKLLTLDGLGLLQQTLNESKLLPWYHYHLQILVEIAQERLSKDGWLGFVILPRNSISISAPRTCLV